MALTNKPDLVLWDSHPLALGATPKQVFIDGISQLEDPILIDKPEAFQKVPQVPNFDEEAQRAIEYEGLPPLLPTKAAEDIVLFTGVKSVLTSTDESAEETFYDVDDDSVVVVVNGSIACIGDSGACASFASSTKPRIVDLKGGSIQPGLSTFGAPLGLQEIDQEPVRALILFVGGFRLCHLPVHGRRGTSPSRIFLS